MLPRPYVVSYSGEKGHQLFHEPWSIALSKSVETFIMVSMSDMQTIKSWQKLESIMCCNIVLQFTNRVMRYIRYGTHSCEVRKVRHTQLWRTAQNWCEVRHTQLSRTYIYINDSSWAIPIQGTNVSRTRFDRTWLIMDLTSYRRHHFSFRGRTTLAELD